jgi:hypothetical protein
VTLRRAARPSISEWNRPQEGEEAAETVHDGSMPPGLYPFTHPDARLTDAELSAMADGLTATLGGEGHEDEDDEGDD